MASYEMNEVMWVYQLRYWVSWMVNRASYPQASFDSRDDHLLAAHPSHRILRAYSHCSFFPRPALNVDI